MRRSPFPLSACVLLTHANTAHTHTLSSARSYGSVNRSFTRRAISINQTHCSFFAVIEILIWHVFVAAYRPCWKFTHRNFTSFVKKSFHHKSTCPALLTSIVFLLGSCDWRVMHGKQMFLYIPRTQPPPPYPKKENCVLPSQKRTFRFLNYFQALNCTPAILFRAHVGSADWKQKKINYQLNCLKNT